jgi:hypothetical protein
MNIGQPSELKYQRGIFTHLSLGQLYPNVEQRFPADRMTITWLAKVCNDIKQYRKVHMHKQRENY